MAWIIVIITIFAFLVGYKMAKTYGIDKERLRFFENESLEKAMQYEKMLDLLEKEGKISNNNVESLLGVSDSTATRFLEELEELGYIRQVGKVGRGVYYESV